MASPASKRAIPQAGWVTRLKRPSGLFTQYAHDANGRVTEVEYHNGEKETYSYYPSELANPPTSPMQRSSSSAMRDTK